MIAVGLSLIIYSCEGVVEEDKKDATSFFLHALVNSDQVSLLCFQTEDTTDLPGNTESRMVISGAFSNFEACKTEEERITEVVLSAYSEVSTTGVTNVMCMSDTLTVSCSTLCLSSKTIGSFSSSGECFLNLPGVVDNMTTIVVNAGNYRLLSQE